MKTQVNKLEANAMATKRWRTRLNRAMTMLDELDRQRKRLEAAPKVPLAKAAGSVARKIDAVVRTVRLLSLPHNSAYRADRQ